MASTSKKPHPADLEDQRRIARAAYFTVFRARGRGENLRERHSSLAQAREATAGDPRALIYAVTPEGSSALVPASYQAE